MCKLVITPKKIIPMNQILRLHILAAIADSKCELRHAPGTESPQAVNAIILPFQTNYLIIPICSECVNTLAEGEWGLLYCIRCCENRWSKKAVEQNPQGRIVWLDGCPECGEFKGTYHVKGELFEGVAT